MARGQKGTTHRKGEARRHNQGHQTHQGQARREVRLCHPADEKGRKSCALEHVHGLLPEACWGAAPHIRQRDNERWPEEGWL